jgi:hypothetical protein
MFRSAVKAITGRDEDEPAPETRRRRGETEGAFQRLARAISRRFNPMREFRGRAAITSRYLTISTEAHIAETAYLPSTLDTLNQWNNEGDFASEFADAFDAEQNHISPHL